MTTLQFNPGYIKAIEEIIVKQSLYENGVELPLIARKFIEIGKQNDINIEVKYGAYNVKENMNINNNGVLDNESNVYSGYYIIAPQKEKWIFKQDVYFENEEDENYCLAMDWIDSAIEYLKTLPNKN